MAFPDESFTGKNVPDEILSSENMIRPLSLLHFCDTAAVDAAVILSASVIHPPPIAL